MGPSETQPFATISSSLLTSNGDPTAIALLALTRLPRVGNSTAVRLFERDFSQLDAGSSEKIYREQYLLMARDYVSSHEEIVSIWNDCCEQLMTCHHEGIRFVTFLDDAYPRRLRGMHGAPAIIFVKGDIRSLHEQAAVAIVGTREPTDFAVRQARQSGRIAATRGVAVVSGLALGCDTLAHEGCLDGQGAGVAVMAHGLDMVYPAANRSLATRLIESGGCLVSEHPPRTKPTRWAFAHRNRLQSGLSDGVLVIETPVSDGTMHTVKFARKQRRRIACMTHPPNLVQSPQAQGNLKLLDAGWAEAIADRSQLSAFLDRIKSDHRVEVRQPEGTSASHTDHEVQLALDDVT